MFKNFWDVTYCLLINSHRRFERACYLHFNVTSKKPRISHSVLNIPHETSSRTLHTRRPVARGVQVGAMHPVHIWMHPIGIRKMSKTIKLSSPLRNVRHPTASSSCLCWPTVAGNNSFSDMRVNAESFVQDYSAPCAITVLMLWSWQGTILCVSLHYTYT